MTSSRIRFVAASVLFLRSLAVLLLLTAGSLPRGSILRVTTEDGRPIGAITPFGATPGQAVQEYTLALPKSVTGGAVVGGGQPKQHPPPSTPPPPAPQQ